MCPNQDSGPGTESPAARLDNPMCCSHTDLSTRLASWRQANRLPCAVPSSGPIGLRTSSSPLQKQTCMSSVAGNIRAFCRPLLSPQVVGARPRFILNCRERSLLLSASVFVSLLRLLSCLPAACCCHRSCVVPVATDIVVVRLCSHVGGPTWLIFNRPLLTPMTHESRETFNTAPATDDSIKIADLVLPYC